MEIKMVDIDKLKPCPWNPRMHSDRQIDVLIRSLKEYGLDKPILATKDNMIIAGHGVVMAARKAGIRSVPVVYSPLVDKKVLARMVMDNRSAELGEDNIPKMADLLIELDDGQFDLELTGFDLKEIEEIMTWAPDLGGNKEVAHKKLTEQFIIPPFSILDTRQGYWQERKKAWLSLGIQGELGRGNNLLGLRQGGLIGQKWTGRKAADLRSNLTGAPRMPKWVVSPGMTNMAPGTSIFDPVLCEVIYRWFCPKDGSVLDPFAGGSVRGIVAGYLGYDYTGVELSPDQVEANRVQSEAILEENTDISSDGIKINISSKWANHLFSCSKDYIIKHCHGRCCEGADKILISLLPEEAKAQKKLGFTVKDGLLLASPKTGKCPHKQANGLCKIHPQKPFGCIASPFTLNNSNTLIIRNRYSKMKCHGQGKPAYKTFRASLNLILGEIQSAGVCKRLESGGGDVAAHISRETYGKLTYLDGLKHGTGDKKKPTWIQGDSQNIDRLSKDQYDLIFSCPPYFDLEHYTEDVKDLSNMDWPQFTKTYQKIINKTLALLKDNRFACFVVSEIRDNKGWYRNFVTLTKRCFEESGVQFYNDIILINPEGTLPIRIGRQFNSYRKVGKMHQNVLVFYKGDIKKIKETYPEVEVADLEDEEQT